MYLTYKSYLIKKAPARISRTFEGMEKIKYPRPIPHWMRT